MASVTPRRNRDGSVSWRVQFRMGQPRKMCQETFSGDGAEVAARQFGALLDRVGPEAAIAVKDARNSAAVGVPTLREYTERYLDPASGLLTGVQEDTRADYQAIAGRAFLPMLGDYPIDAITKPDVGAWVTWQEAQPSKRRSKGEPQNVSSKTVQNYHALLSAILQSAVEQRIRPDNPAFKVSLTRGQKHEAVFLTDSEFATFLHFVPEYYKPLVAFLAGSGMRWSEATALEKRDVNLDNDTARVTKAWKKNGKIGPPKTDRARRTVALFPELVSNIPTEGVGSSLLFQGPLNGSRVWYGNFKNRIWDKAVDGANDAELCEAAGFVPLGKRPTPHDLRHSHASWLIDMGLNLPEVQAQLGHEKITTTVDVYGHLMPHAHARVSAAMRQKMSNVFPAVEA